MPNRVETMSIHHSQCLVPGPGSLAAAKGHPSADSALGAWKSERDGYPYQYPETARKKCHKKIENLASLSLLVKRFAAAS